MQYDNSCFKDLVVKDHNTLMLNEPKLTRKDHSDAVVAATSNNNLALKSQTNFQIQ